MCVSPLNNIVTHLCLHSLLYTVYYGYDFAICYFIVSSCLVVLLKYCLTLTIQFEGVLSAVDEMVRVFWSQARFIAFCCSKVSTTRGVISFAIIYDYKSCRPTLDITPNAGWQVSVYHLILMIDGLSYETQAHFSCDLVFT